jgi:hypothetical protein
LLKVEFRTLLAFDPPPGLGRRSILLITTIIIIQITLAFLFILNAIVIVL